MSLSLTCTCGAKLEIDDKFAGKVIVCPDCHRELSTAPREVHAAHTSGFAIASLLLALVGVFSVLGPLLAIAAGLIALRHMKRFPEQVGGQRYAKAGIVLGCLFTVVGVAGHWSPEIFGLDGVFREIEWAKRLDRPDELRLDNKDSDSAPIKFAVTRPRKAWGILRSTNEFPRSSSDLILIEPWQDAQLACMTWDQERNVDEEDLAEEARDFFLKSELVQIIARSAVTPKPLAERKIEMPKGSRAQELVIDVKLAGIERTFIIRAVRSPNRPSKFNILAAGARKSRFHRLEPELRKFLDSYETQP